uniref:Taste receptor type 1 member 2 (Sweet taste receptor T1R2) n=1 Tax=mine drainage metagenome TaxID=410659 RepID=E6QTH9_9ZZZZ
MVVLTLSGVLVLTQVVKLSRYNFHDYSGARYRQHPALRRRRGRAHGTCTGAESFPSG